ncbi:MAG: tRNA (adenosine(37)-N6)-threonylcarbamoyltransferase complex ATPase subunit type 1 TsaE [Phycisphaerae bacterium]|nr:tRNA (adenosine(37)-N6)-threonylcarbamoyltransferase complex ATPase subunit type 1 TsaE [Phycisphaerae bacterium]
MSNAIITTSVEQTLAWGRLLGALALPGACIALDGILGVGKTQLVRGMAVGSQVQDCALVCSPTYCLLNIYQADASRPGAKTLYHLDAYRVRDADQFAAVGFEELLEQQGLVVLEWASRVPNLLPEDHLAIVGTVEAEFSRRWCIRAGGPVSHRLLETAAADWSRISAV